MSDTSRARRKERALKSLSFDPSITSIEEAAPIYSLSQTPDPEAERKLLEAIVHRALADLSLSNRSLVRNAQEFFISNQDPELYGSFSYICNFLDLDPAPFVKFAKGMHRIRKRGHQSIPPESDT